MYCTLGWRAYATNAPQTRLSFENAVLEYRNEFRIERVFGRFKGEQLAIAPLFVKRDDQVVGLTRLLSLAVRVLTRNGVCGSPLIAGARSRLSWPVSG